MEQAYTMTKEQMKIEKRRRKIAKIKHELYMLWYAAYWRFLHFTRPAGPYSKLMCKFNLYGRFPDGRCQWCGINHGFH